MKTRRSHFDFKIEVIWLIPIVMVALLWILPVADVWPLTLFLHFPLHIGAMSFMYFGLAWLMARRLAALVALIFSLIMGASHFSWAIEGQGSTTNNRSFRIMHYNIQLENRAIDSITAVLDQSDADLVFLHELTPEVWGRLMKVQKKWPFGQAVPRPDYYGVGVLSRFPLAELRFQELSQGRIPVAMVRLANINFPHTIMSPHIITPLSYESHQQQLAQLAELASWIKAQPPSTILIGDLNTTPLHPSFLDFLERTGLQDGRKGFGMLPSWPQPVTWAGIAIDHILTRGNFAISNLMLRDGGASDHRALLSDIAIKL